MESGVPGPEAPQAIQPAVASDTPSVRPGSGPPSAAYPVVTEFDRQDEYNRWLPLVKWLLLVPHFFALVFIGIGAAFALWWAFFVVLFTGKFPQGVHSFVVGVVRWATRVNAYAMLMTDTYPPFSMDEDQEYPARIDIAYTENIANWRPLVNWILIIPYAIVSAALIWVAGIITFIAFFAILFTKQFPQGLFDFNVVAYRWQNRSNAYMYFLTEKYPPWEWS